MEFKVFIGTDVSKETLDLAVRNHEGKLLLEERIANSPTGIKKLFKELKTQIIEPFHTWVVCMEHTGIYCNHLLNYLKKEGIPAWLENPLAIKAYFGIERGKNDRLDARRISEYLQAKRHKIRIWEPPREVVGKLKNLLTIRERLIKTRKSLMVAVKEPENFVAKELLKVNKKFTEPIIEKLDCQLRVIEQMIKKTINDDKDLKKLNDQVDSVVGVGEVIAAHVIVATNEFKNINDPRKMACHAGVAPFAYSSGIFKGKAKVSHRANKSLKSLFYLAARSAVKAKGELKEYFERQVAKGKNGMSVLNAIANKIIHRIFACVRQNRKYEKNYAHALAKP